MLILWFYTLFLEFFFWRIWIFFLNSIFQTRALRCKLLFNYFFKLSTTFKLESLGKSPDGFRSFEAFIASQWLVTKLETIWSHVCAKFFSILKSRTSSWRMFGWWDFSLPHIKYVSLFSWMLVAMQLSVIAQMFYCRCAGSWGHCPLGAAKKLWKRRDYTGPGLKQEYWKLRTKIQILHLKWNSMCWNIKASTCFWGEAAKLSFILGHLSCFPKASVYFASTSLRSF